MAFPKPQAPPYDVGEWQRKPYLERVQMVCRAWAMQGYGTPWPIYLVYLVKALAYVGGWAFFCSFTPGLGDLRVVGSWWHAPAAFQKAILWSIAFEGLGLGCGSGPLTGRYFPPLGGVLYFARRGTTKAPLFPGIPLFGGDRRTAFDVALYVAHYALLVRALIAEAEAPSLLVPPLVLLCVLGVTDKTIFLASRAEHYATVLVCLLFAHDWIPACKVVWLAVWWWAATSKLNHHFPSVVAVMQSNSPLLPFQALKKRLFVHYPDDLRPSRLTHALAHAGTVTEIGFPLALALGDGGPATRIALATMLVFHLFITCSVPMGVPIEWNVMMVYGAFFLFGHHATVSVLSLSTASPALIGYLVVACFAVQVLGNLYPSRVSFLCAMRYYAGNWAYSVWLFRGDASRKLDTHLVKSSAGVRDQLARFYDAETTTALLSKVVAFRAMHVQGRVLPRLIPKAVDDVDAYEYLDGELVAGVVIGWNFGDGHLHGPQLLRSVQRQCGFEEGELRCIFVEGQPMGGSSLAWTIEDAKTGVRERGQIAVRELLSKNPWEK